MVKLSHLIDEDHTEFDTAITIEADVPMIGDVQGFAVDLSVKATYDKADVGSVMELIDETYLQVDGGERLHDIVNWNLDSLATILKIVNKNEDPTDESLDSGVTKHAHMFLPFTIIRALFQTAKLVIRLIPGTDLNANITAMETKVRIATAYGPVPELVRINTVQRSDVGPHWPNITMPSDRGNLTGAIVIAHADHLIDPDAIFTIKDEAGLPMMDSLRPGEIISYNEYESNDAWTGAYKTLWALYMDCPLIACKPDLTVDIRLVESLDAGLQVCWLNSYAEQRLSRPENASGKMIECGAYNPNDVFIRTYRSLADQIARMNVPLAVQGGTGSEVATVEKTIQA